VKSLRVFLLILLAALLPLRGAIGAEGLCSLAQGPMGASHAAVHGSHDVGRASASHQHHASAGAQHAHGEPHGGANPCNFCSAFGGIAGPIAPLAVPARSPGAKVFARVEAPPARLIADRLERPPRTL
jgi:hypothetical protein